MVRLLRKPADGVSLCGRGLWLRAWLGALVVGLFLAGCTAASYKRSADKEVYSIISAKSAQVPGMEKNFRLGEMGEAGQILEKIQGSEDKPTKPVSLVDAIIIAAYMNRDFQSQREDVYLKALDLTFTRYLWAPHASGVLSGMWQDAAGEHSVSGDSSFGFTQALATGADVSLSLSSSFLRFLSGDPRESAASVIDFSLVQPLWRGAGRRIAQENLTQGERDVIYELRSFVRFRQQFFVSIASDYYRVLQQLDNVNNQLQNMDNLELSYERAKALGEAGRLPDFQVAQAEQEALAAKDSWIRAKQLYESLLDSFKISLGLPTNMPIELDYGELERLRSATLPVIAYAKDEASQTALGTRLDFANSLDAVADAERKLAVAENNLGPDLDLVLRSSIGTEPDTKFLDFTRSQSSYSAGLELSLPLDRKSERNQYRRAFITLDRAKRTYELEHDRVLQDVNNAWRGLTEARQSYEIQLKSVQIAESRADATSMLVEAGRAIIRDILDAQASLLRARNTLTQAIVDYRITMLQLWRDMGTLTFKDGQFQEETPNVEGSGNS